MLLAIFVFAFLSSHLCAAAQSRSNISSSLDESKKPVVLSVQKRFGRTYRRKRIAVRDRGVYKKRSPGWLKTARRKHYRNIPQNTSKTAVRMTDKNNNTQENDASTKNEAKKAGTFDGDLRDLPPVKPIVRERPKRKDPPTKPRVLIMPTEPKKKTD